MNPELSAELMAILTTEPASYIAKKHFKAVIIILDKTSLVFRREKLIDG